MKILFIHECCGRHGGAEENILATARHLSHSFDLELLCGKHTGKDEGLFSEVFLKIYMLDWSQDEAALRRRVKQTLSESGPNLVYFHKCLSAPLIEAVLEYDVPTVRMVHDHEVYCMRTYKYFPWSRKTCHYKAGLVCLVPCGAFLMRDRTKGRLGVRWVSFTQKQRLIHADQRLDAFIVASQYMSDELVLQGYDKSKIAIMAPVPPGEERVSSRLNLLESHKIVFAGQIVRGKGLDCLLRALALVKVPFELVVLGKGSALPFCQQLANELGLGNRVHFLGYAPHNEMAIHYHTARLGVVPSVWPEPFGMVGIEMMQQGIPVIAFDSGGISDWLKDGETGYLVPNMDVQGLAEKIELVLTDTELAKRLGRNAVSWVHSRFRFRAYVERLTMKFERMINPDLRYRWLGVPLHGLAGMSVRPQPLPQALNRLPGAVKLTGSELTLSIYPISISQKETK
ncbi:MAG: glycosyltransferase family 4 protein [Chlamydiales bacterium]|nr:glycosyltransferase family 4 protein [Chlamydiales bacterium]